MGTSTRSLAAVLAACVAAVTVVDAQRSTEVKIGTIAPDGSAYVNALREMGDAWRKRTGGRVTARIYPASDSTEESIMVDMRPAVRKLHGAQLSAITLSNVDSAFNIFGLPLFFESYEEADRVLEALQPELERRLEAKGYKALNFAYVGWVHLFSKKPVATVDDLRKLPLYTSTGDDRFARWYNTNGFRAVPLDPTMMLTSLKTNMIAAIPVPPLFAQLLEYDRAAPHMMDLGFAPLLGATVMSLDTWKRISAADQAIVLEEARKSGARLRRDVPRLEREAIDAMKKKGLKVIAAERAGWRKMADQLGEAMQEHGVLPREIYDLARRERDALRAGEVRIGTIAPEGSAYVGALREMGDAWKKRTGGRVTAVIHPGGDATEESIMADVRPAVRKLHGAQLSAITLGNLDSAFNVFGLPLFLESYEEADRVLEALRPELERRLEAKGYKALNFAYVGWVHLFSKKPVATVNDLRKLPLYTSTGDDRLAKWYTANGFRPVPLDPAAMVPSLETNRIEAIPVPPLYAQLLEYDRAAPHMMDLGFAPLLGATVMSLDAWKRISAADQAIVLEEARRSGARLRRDVPKLEREAIDAMKKKGLKVVAADRPGWRRIADQLAKAMQAHDVVPGEIYDLARRERDALRAGK
jgi:TRAP-type transport system periplasmic protein